ncbi:MAG: carbohydrate ABC transporter permease [Chloroflexi bacterium]|nr:carbohydrate ABC transporter permease [Chloroflexota bacterium]
MSTPRVRRWINRILWPYLPLAIVLIALLFPFYWMIITSLKTFGETYNLTSPLIVKEPTLSNYVWLFEKSSFARWYLNSFLVTVSTTLFSLVVSLMAGYAIAHLRFSGAAVIGILIFVTYLIPRTLLFIPVTVVVQQLGAYGKLVSLILVYPTFVIPFCTWLLSGYFRTLPLEPEECAMVDGCSRIGAIVRITLPLAVPGILTAGIFGFTLAWNELLYAIILVNGEMNRTLPVGIVNNLINRDTYLWGPLMAAATLGSVPVALFYFFFMDLYVGGLTAGAVKG